MFILFYKFLFFFTDLLEIQRKSFYSFLNFKLSGELSKIKPVLSSRKLARRRNSSFSNTEKKDKDRFFPTSLYFLYENYKFITPSLTIEESIIFSKTYCCRFYIPVKLVDSITNLLEIQWIFLGTLPLLTKRGHFIINGTPRVILNQIVRSPGIYFHKENSYDSSRCFYAEIISRQGPWIRLEIDKKKKIWISFQQSGITRFSLSYFFQTFFQKYIDHQFFLWEKNQTLKLNGILLNNFFWKDPMDIIQNTKKEKLLPIISPTLSLISYNRKPGLDFSKMTKKIPKNFNYYIPFFIALKTQFIYKENKKSITGLLRYFKIPDKKNNKSQIFKDFNKFGLNSTILFASSTLTKENLGFNLGKIGRKRLNQRLGLSLKTLTLTPIDFLAISDILFQLIQNTNKDNSCTGLIATSLDDIDDLKNRQIKTIGELLQNQLARGIQRLQKTFENVFKKDFKKLFKYSKVQSRLINLNILEQPKRNLGWVGSNPKTKALNNKFFKHNPPNNLFILRSFTKRNSYLIRLQKLENFKRLNLNFQRNFLWKDLLNLNAKPIKKQYNTYKSNKVLKRVRPKFNTQKEKKIQISSLFNTQAINSVFKEFFHSHQLSQYLDQSNPLAELTHKRRLSCLGSGGVNRDNAGMEIRGIHVSHYGRICPIETPEGKNAGLVNSLTTTVNINKTGYLETPFCEVFKQHTQNQKKLMFFSSENQQIQNVFFSPKIPQAKNVSIGVLQTGYFKKCASNLINLIAFNPQQFIAIATTCIPFVEHDDANRALMGSNMQRQALPLLKLEQPLVTTLNAFRVLSDLKDIPTSINSGIILYASQQKISFYPQNRSNVFG